MKILGHLIFLTIGLTVLAVSAQTREKGPQSTQSQVLESMRATTVVRGHFTQKKYIPALEKPLKSKGTFLYAKAHGIYWVTLEPFDSQMVITPEGFFERQGSGRLKRLGPKGHGQLIAFSKALIHVFSGDQDRLEKNFDLSFKGNPKNWSLQLNPKGRSLKKGLSKIVLQGSRTIQSFEIYEKSGTKTRTDFSQIQTEPKNLTQREKKFFLP